MTENDLPDHTNEVGSAARMGSSMRSGRGRRRRRKVGFLFEYAGARQESGVEKFAPSLTTTDVGEEEEGEDLSDNDGFFGSNNSCSSPQSISNTRTTTHAKHAHADDDDEARTAAGTQAPQPQKGSSQS